MSAETQEPLPVNYRDTELYKQTFATSGIRYDMLSKLEQALKREPLTIKQMMQEVGSSINHVTVHVKYLVAVGKVVKMPGSATYRWDGHDYGIDLDNSSIERIPEAYFREIPIIKKWYQRNIEDSYKKDLITMFKNICYGNFVPSFKIHPARWKHPEDTEQLFLAYKEKRYLDDPKVKNIEYPATVRKAIKAFLTECLRVTIIKAEAEYCGLFESGSNMGKYRFIRLTEQDIPRAIEWLQAEGLDVAKVEGITDRIQAHFAYALWGFARPSRVLTVAVDSIGRYSNGRGGDILHWMQYETKQSQQYPKLILDPTLAKWAWDWAERRRAFSYNYLFVDNNNYVVEKNDSRALQKERASYTAVYKKLFEHLGKKEALFYSDTLYAIRHSGVNLWIDYLVPKVGYGEALLNVMQMGWENMQTLLRHYAGVTSKDIMQKILSVATSPEVQPTQLATRGLVFGRPGVPL